MLNAIGGILALLLIALVGVLFASFYFLDRLIRYEYASHRDAWERDGRPAAWFFRPSEATWFRSGFAFQWCALPLPLHTPAWVRGDPAAKVLHTRLRWCVLTWNAGFFTWFLLFAWYLSSTQSI